MDERLNLVTVVRAGLEQRDALRSVRLRALLCDPDAFGATYEQELLNPARFWEDRLVQSAWFLASAEGLPAGLVACVTPPPGFERERQLDAMWVDPRWRGTGLSHRLVAEVVRYAVETNAAALTLTVAETNTAARRCYEGVGFETTGERFRRKGRPGQFSVRMRLSLADRSR